MKVLTREEKIYRLQNRFAYWKYAKTQFGVYVAKKCGVATMWGDLRAVLCKRTYPGDGGRMIDLGLLSTRLITDTGVDFMGDDWFNDGTNIADMNYHDSGTNNTAESASDTGLNTAAGPSTRATGTKSQPANGQVRSVGTISYTGTLAIVEHGLFNQAARGGGSVMWDRSIFSTINVVNGDAIQFTYTATLSSGG